MKTSVYSATKMFNAILISCHFIKVTIKAYYNWPQTESINERLNHFIAAGNSCRYIECQSRIYVDTRWDVVTWQTASLVQKSSRSHDGRIPGEKAENLNRPSHVEALPCVWQHFACANVWGLAEKVLGKVQMIALTHRVDTIGNTVRLPCSRESNEFCINKHSRPTSPLPPAAQKTSGGGTVECHDQMLPHQEAWITLWTHKFFLFSYEMGIQ